MNMILKEPKRKTLLKKIFIIGDSGVGKKTLADNVAPFKKGFKGYTATIGTAITKYGLEFKIGKRYIRLKVLVWDITGKETYEKMHPRYMSGAEAAIIMADAHDLETINNLPFWIEKVKKVVGKIPMVVVVNKIDLIHEKNRKSLDRYVLEKIKKYDIPVFYLSAKDMDKNALKAPFFELAKEIIKRIKSK